MVYETTGQFIWNSEASIKFIRDVAAVAPSLNDFEICYRAEYEKTSPLDWHAALKATKARLVRMELRAEKAEVEEQRAKANRAIFEQPLYRQMREAIAANYDKPQGGNGHEPGASVGALTPLRDLLPSLNGGQAQVLTDADTPDSAGAARRPGRSSPSSSGSVRPSPSGPPDPPDGRGDEEGGS